ncbi:MAG: putative ATP-binding protein [uncultured Frankineae bacterium]|uniref:Putative ATP-binding protein n=1 Tax=uncultured Frankineae bacterium TaxID=437475 RepID=A0A6J4LT82_9ACTN|nr:MAG: putative ATP-binding protein [uncultured Frankineae bacterium]
MGASPLDSQESSVEVKIGVQFAPRELSLESSQSPEEVAQAVSEALRADLGVLTLVDEKGRRVLVPADKLAYVEIAETEQRRVGFGAL